MLRLFLQRPRKLHLCFRTICYTLCEKRAANTNLEAQFKKRSLLIKESSGKIVNDPTTSKKCQTNLLDQSR